MTDTTKKRPEFRNINPISDLTTYRLPVAAKLSILHRASGLVMFFLLPFVIWLLDTSISSEFSYARFTAAFNTGAGIFPGWFIKLAVLALIWSYLHHFCAGLRHIWMDVSHKSVNKEFGKNSALACFAISLLLTAILGAKLFGLY
ncbi:MAG: succinate dehydrogenase, cytochrome b556 subunit [Comamonas sp.]|jgi:succinate dehydrogenase / fumarate reductase cytochrome b subunit|uniref:succinate dehydrogenase, cytochrome b556 subunit n=1 Tax=Comamonas sp. BIGb0152 TaxID=2940601 RepID=UPI0021685618|nr:succinate dehydrogenase, cytochrome b556 subunit [Comamonas sp. BIGb0152]MCS4293413.1 succinate dehydrogenase / fumarate reductase cytochrome b subunit [Comamonas sp. BIGb0152]